jgi:hypothetical protein
MKILVPFYPAAFLLACSLALPLRGAEMPATPGPFIPAAPTVKPFPPIAFPSPENPLNRSNQSLTPAKSPDQTESQAVEPARTPTAVMASTPVVIAANPSAVAATALADSAGPKERRAYQRRLNRVEARLRDAERSRRFTAEQARPHRDDVASLRQRLSQRLDPAEKAKLEAEIRTEESAVAETYGR